MPSSLAIQYLHKNYQESWYPESQEERSATILPVHRRESTAGELRSDLLDVGLHQLDQLPNGVGVEGEPGARGAVNLGQTVDGAQSQSLPVAGDCTPRVAQAVAPYLKCADLGNAILDIVEGIHEDVQLAVPAGHPLLLQPAPVDPPLEPAPQPEPGLISCDRIGSLTTGVDPSLERVHRRDVGETDEHVFEMLEPGSSSVDRLEISRRLSQVGSGQKLHGHGGQLGRLRAGVTLPDQG